MVLLPPDLPVAGRAESPSVLAVLPALPRHAVGGEEIVGGAVHHPWLRPELTLGHS